MGFAAAGRSGDEEDELSVAVGAGEIHTAAQTSECEGRFGHGLGAAVWNGDSARDAGTGLGLAVDGGLCQTGDVGGSAGVMDQRGQVGDNGVNAVAEVGVERD